MKKTQGKKIYKIAISFLLLNLVVTGLIFFQQIYEKEMTKTSSSQKETSEEFETKETKDETIAKTKVHINPIPTDYEASLLKLMSMIKH